VLVKRVITENGSSSNLEPQDVFGWKWHGE